MSRPTDLELHPVRTDEDIVRVRGAVRAAAGLLKMGTLIQTKLVTAASELARNALEHGGGGTMRLEHLLVGGRRGLRLTFADQGPGILDIAQAMTDHFTTGRGMGLGLGGAKRLCSNFDIVSTPGEGTRVTIVQWA